MQNNNQYNDSNKISNKRASLILGSSYIFISIGFFFDYLTIFLFWLLEPIPDRFFFLIINQLGIFDNWPLTGTIDINGMLEYERVCFLVIAFLSLLAFIIIFVSIWQLVSNPKIPIIKSVFSLIGALILGSFTGFTTCLNLFILN